MIPRDAKSVLPFVSTDEAFTSVAKEISDVVVYLFPFQNRFRQTGTVPNPSADLVQQQIRSYARLHERTWARMPPSSDRTRMMDEIADNMRIIALATHPLLDELVLSPFPGERLAAITIL